MVISGMCNHFRHVHIFTAPTTLPENISIILTVLEPFWNWTKNLEHKIKNKD